MSHVFISYGKKNQDYARKLADYLLEQGFDVWIDDKIDYGTKWWRVIVRAIEECAAFIVIMTPESGASDWVEREVMLALQWNKSVFPLLLSGENWPLFVITQYVDIHDGSLPPADFCDRLARCAPKQAQTGTDVTESPPPPESAPVIIPVPEPTFTLPMLEWVDIPAGRMAIEGKEYPVEAFRIGKYPVTYAQFQAFIDAPDGFYHDEWWHNLSKREVEPGRQRWPAINHPRERVSWYDAIAFCRWLSQKTGLSVSLPTEQQWQRAAQGDDNREYPWGDEFDSGRCNTTERGIGKTTPVNRYPSGISPYGIFDMAGNVWEWCLNEFDNPEIVDLIGEERCVLRGGAWGTNAFNACTTCRYGRTPHRRSSIVGFRLAAERPLISAR